MESLSSRLEKLIFGCSPGGVGSRPAVITVIGSGGKTSLIWLLARQLSQKPARKVLVTPATKMFLPDPVEKLFDRYCESAPPAPIAGVTLTGHFNQKTGKLESLPLPELERVIGGYDLVLIEGDGSRQLPLKAWADHEPVVPTFTTITVGMIPLRPLGMPVTEKIIHRLPLFCALSGASPGEALNLTHLAAVISGGKDKRSLFTAAQGRKVLFINQVETEAALDQARELVSLLPPEFHSGLHKILAGSVRLDMVWEISTDTMTPNARQ